MYGWRYGTICPFCNHKFEAEHGITAHVQIRGHGDLEYIDLRCPRCEKRYYRCLVDELAFYQRLSGIREADAIDEAVKRHLCYRMSIQSITNSGLMDSIRRRYRDAYSIPDRDLFVDAALVDKDDITITCGCCY